MTGGTTVFFQIAASLIPAIMFGAILSDRVHPPVGFFEGHFWRGVIVTITAIAVVFLATAAEIAAIVAALGSGPPSQWSVLLVSTVLVGATTATLAVIAWPWIQWHGKAKGYSAYVLAAGAFMAVIYMANSVNYAPRDATAPDLELAALGDAVKAWQAEGLIQPSTARRYERCIADKELRVAIYSSFEHHWGFANLQNQPLYAQADQTLDVPGGLVQLIRHSEASSSCRHLYH